MINTSAEYKTAILNNRILHHEATIEFTDGTTLTPKDIDLYTFKIAENTSNQNSFDIGSVIAKQLNLKISNIDGEYNQHKFSGAKITARVGLEISERTEWLKKGVYYAEPGSFSGDTISVTAYDSIMKFDTPYSESTLKYPATLGEIVRDACNVCDVTMSADLAIFSQSSLVVQNRPSDSSLTFRQVLQCVGEISCLFFRMDEDDRLTASWYDTDLLESEQLEENAIKIEHYTGTVETDDVVITGVRVTEESSDENTETNYEYGTTGYVLEIKENKLIQTGSGASVVESVGKKINGLIFRPLSIKCQGDPAREAGDIAVVTDRKGNKYKTILTGVTYTAKAQQDLICGAESPAQQSATRYSKATQVYRELRKTIRQQRTEFVKALESLQNAMDEKEGLHPVTEELEDGSRILYFCDHATLEESKVVIKLNAEGWGMSTDGGKTWNVGALVDGTTITKILNAIGINADWINTGAITIKDPQGNVIFQADMDAKRVTISGESVRLGKSSLNDKMASLENDVALSRNMTMTLTNDFQTITTNADGSIPPGTFPDVSTQAIVMYGSQDITKECSFTITKSDAVSGNWDEATATYTVTGITEDSAWVDIKATYLSTLSVTKRFGISKIKAESERTYFIEPSCNVLKRSADNTMSPNFIEFKAYYRDGTSTTRTAYNGRFVIEETKDGNTWTTLYTSSADENTVKHYLYSIPVDGSSQAISDSTTMIGIPRDVTNIRCRLYAAGGTTTLMDMESVAVVVDVDALTHEEIFDLLTNKGMIKGIYKEGDQVYISFTYAKGGTLALGGVGNGNGKLIILDASGNQVGYIDNTGVNFEKGTFTGILSATSGDIGGWIIDKANGTLKSANGKIVLNSKDDRITINGVPIRAYGNGVIIDGGLTIRTGSDDFSDGTDSFQLYNISTLTSGNYLRLYNNGVFQSSSSSKRYKEIGQDISEKDIDPWYNIQPVWAKYKDGYLMKNDSRNGIEFPMFVAEDVEEYFPLAVDHLEDGKAENWNERIMIPAMFAMLKFQKQKIDILENEITEIKKLLEEKKE